MISVCIPVFNTCVHDLVKELVRQIGEIDVPAEILVFDDASDLAYRQKNKSVHSFQKVIYKEVSKNQGRIRIRQLLAAAAQYPWLLFIDSDSRVVRKNFIKVYQDYCNPHWDVLIGGRIYSHQAPEDCRLALHWNYGSKREKVSVANKIFLTNNFCIRKEVFTQLNFPEVLKGYGHEDTWMGIVLKQSNTRVYYFDNPVLHEGLEDASTFIQKTKQALQNLSVLEKVVGPQRLKQHVKLYQKYILLKQLGMHKLLMMVCQLFQKPIQKNLCSCRPSLALFDVYRLGLFTTLMQPPLQKGHHNS